MSLKRWLHELAARVHDDLTLVCGRSARLIGGRLDGKTRRLSIQVLTVHQDMTARGPDLGVDEGYRIASATAALERLRSAVSVAGRPWRGDSLQLLRLHGGPSVLRLLGGAGKAGVNLVIAPDDPAVMVPDLLFDVAAATERALGPPVPELAVAAPAGGSPSWYLESREAAAGTGVRVNVVGRYAPALHRMSWAFADGSIDPRSSAAARRASDSFRRLGLRVFTVPEIDCEPGFASALARMAAYRAGSRGALALRRAQCTYFLALP
jgi:hypothetical protein